MRALHHPTAWQPGIGLHTGERTAARVLPPRAGASGVLFRRVDLPAGPTVLASLGSAAGVPRLICLQNTHVQVATVEHLLAALAGCGIWAAEVEVRGPELPALDGSAREWTFALLEASVPAPQHAGACLSVARRWRRSVGGGDRFTLAPAGSLSVRCEILYEHASVGRQSYDYRPGSDPVDDFARELAPARTFGLLSEAAQLRTLGLARGASLDNVLVFGAEGALNPGGLRFPDEPARHKVLDAVGALALLGAPLRGRLDVFRCGHLGVVESLKLAVARGVIEPERVNVASSAGDG